MSNKFSKNYVGGFKIICKSKTKMSAAAIRIIMANNFETLNHRFLFNTKIINKRNFRTTTMSKLTVEAPKILSTPLAIPEKTMMGPGPTNVPERIRNAMAQPTIGHLHPEFCKVNKRLKNIVNIQSIKINFSVKLNFMS